MSLIQNLLELASLLSTVNVGWGGAELINGLLTINLEKIIPEEKKSKKIEIKSPKRISNK